MRGHEWDWDGFPHTERTADDVAQEELSARENAPSIVLGRIGLILAVTLSLVFGLNMLLMIEHIH